MQVRPVNTLIAFAAASLFGGSALAAPTASFMGIPVTDAGAFADDPTLAGPANTPKYFQNFLSVTTTDGTAKWTNSTIRIALSSGSVYNATNTLFGGAVQVGTDASPNPALWSQVGARNGAFDTFVNEKGQTAPADSNPRPVGLQGGVAPEVVPTGLTENGGQVVSVAWGLTLADLQNPALDQSGTFSNARFTLSLDAVGTFSGQHFDTLSGGIGTPFSGVIVGGVMSIPEPGSLALVGLAAAAGLIRRRRSA